jgi:hypothetical protein
MSLQSIGKLDVAIWSVIAWFVFMSAVSAQQTLNWLQECELMVNPLLREPCMLRT